MDSNLTKDELKTLSYYEKSADIWLNNLAVGQNNLLFEEQLQTFNKFLPNGKILEIGCGAGNDGQWFVSKNYDYIGTDISQAMITLCKKRFPSGDFQQMSVYKIEFENNTFDGFWASLVIHHVPKNKLDVALKELFRVLKPTGIGFISLKKGEEERFEENQERFYAFYSRGEFEDKLHENGFKTIDYYETELGKTTFLLFFVRKCN